MSVDAKLSKQYKVMTETSIPKLVIKLGIPTTISMLVTNVYNMADTYFVGQLGTSASGAVGIVFGLMGIIQAFGFMFGHGAGSIVARKLGAEDINEASRFASISFFTSILTGIIVTILGLIFLRPLMNLLGSTETIYPYSKTYATYILLSSSVMMSSFVLNCILRFEGKAIFAMVGLSIGGIINIFGDYITIKILGMGIEGAGISTAVSQLISFFILFSFAKSDVTQSDLSFKNIYEPIEALKEIVATGFPSLLRQGLASVSAMLLNNNAAMYGDAAIAAMAIVNRIQMFVFAVSLGLSQGFQPVSGFNYGAKKYNRVKESFIFTVIISEIILGFFAIIGIVFSEELIYFFRNDTEVLKVGVFALRVQLLALFFYPIIFCANMMLQSVGWNKQASILSSLRNGLFYIPIITILPMFIGLKGIQLAQPLSDLLAFIFTFPFLTTFIKDLNLKAKANLANDSNIDSI